MALSHSLGFPCVGRDHQLSTALAAHCRGELDEAGLLAVGKQLRATHWQAQKDAGLDLLPVGDFAWDEPVLSHSLAFGVIPERLRPATGQPTLATLLAMARGTGAQEPGQWFDSASHYRVPEFAADQAFALSWEQLFEEVDEARALGHNVKPVLIGPLTYLWLGQARDGAFDTLELLERLLPVYGDIFQRLAAQGVDWVQLDEPILALELPQAWKNAFERAYNLIQREPCRKLIATYFGGLADNLGLAANLPVDGLHVDLVCAPRQLPTLLDRLPVYKVLSLGVVNGRDTRRCALDEVLELLRHAHERLGERLWVAPSCSLRHDPLAQANPAGSAPQGWTAVALEKCRAVALLGKMLAAPDDAAVLAALTASHVVQAGRAA